MRSSLYSLSVLFFLLLITAPAPAQIGRLLKRKIQQHAERAADKAVAGLIDRAIERELNKLFGLDSSRMEIRGDTLIWRDSVGAPPTILVSEEAPVDPEPSAFIGSFAIEVASFKKDIMEKGFPVRMHYFVDKYALAMVMRGEQSSTIIIDRKERTMTTKMDHEGEKKAIVMPLRTFMISGGPQAEPYAVKETGNTKTIDGYPCREFLLESDGEITHAWITEDIAIDWQSMFSFLKFQQQSQSALRGWDALEGAPVFTRTEVKGKPIRRESRMVDFREGKVPKDPFSLKGYAVQEMPSIFTSRPRPAESGE